MNRLANMRFYLAGPMDYSPDHGVGWRKQIKLDLADLHIEWLDPSNKPTMLAVEDANTYERLRRAKERGDFDYVRKIMRPIRNIDLRMVDIADALIVHLDLTIPATGSIEEIVTANRAKKPVLIHVEQGKVKASNWLLAMLPHQFIFSTWNDLYDYVRYVASGEDANLFNRWAFFNFQGEQ